MAGGKWNVISGWISCFRQSEPPHSNPVASGSVKAAPLAMEKLKCERSVEENKLVCEHGGVQAEQTAKANSSFVHSVGNMVGMLIGLGQLSTPYALENGGWVAYAFIVSGLAIICVYTSHLIGKCLKKNPESNHYLDIGEHAFGMRGRVTAATLMYLEIFLVLVTYTISLSDNLGRLFIGTHLKPWAHLSTTQLLTIIAVLVTLPSLWLKDLSSISFLSFGGILMSIVILTSLGWTAAFSGLKLNHRITVFNLHKIPTISGLYIFSFGGHMVFPNIYKAMKDPSKFTKVAIVSFALVTIIYTSLAFVGAKLFGPEVESQFTLSMPRHLLVTKIALWATVLTPMTKYALTIVPIVLQLEDYLLSSMSSKKWILVRGTFASILLIGILILALTFPYFQHVLGLTGSLVSATLSITLPCAFHLKVCWSQVSKSTLILNLFVMSIGCFFGILGTISSFKSLVISVERGHSS